MPPSLADVWFRVTDLDVVSGEGCWVTAADGSRYLDFSRGIAQLMAGLRPSRARPRCLEVFAKALAATSP
jgi:4-aminobutyrate aminotransferase-like enzyme